MLFVISQIIGLIAFVISLIAYQQTKKETILKCMIVSYIFNIIHYFLLNAYSGMIVKFISVIRDLTIIMKNKYVILQSKVMIYIFILIYLGLLIYSYKNILSTFPFIGALVYMLLEWNGNVKKIKCGAYINYLLWLIYNISIFSISGFLSNTISLLFLMLSTNNKNLTNNKNMLK